MCIFSVSYWRTQTVHERPIRTFLQNQRKVQTECFFLFVSVESFLFSSVSALRLCSVGFRQWNHSVRVRKTSGFSLKQLFCSSRSQVEISTAVFTIFWCLRPQKHLEHLQLTSSCETPAACIISVSLLHHSYSLFLSACINTLVVWKQIYIFFVSW